MKTRKFLLFLCIGMLLSACDSARHFAHMRINHSYKNAETTPTDDAAPIQKSAIENKTVANTEEIPVQSKKDETPSKQQQIVLKNLPSLPQSEQELVQETKPEVSPVQKSTVQAFSKEKSVGNALATFLVAILLFLLALVFFLFLGAVGLIFFIIFIIAAVILLIVGLIALI